MLTNHNNLWRFIDIKSLSSKQVCWTQKLSKYHFWIDYCQGKANRAANTMSRFSQINHNKEKKLWAGNIWLFHYLQSLLTNATLSDLSILVSLLLLHQVFICKTPALPQPCWFWNLLWTKLIDEAPYLAFIGNIRLRLQELQETDYEAQELRQQGRECYKNVNGILHYQGPPFVPKVIWIELISSHYNNSLLGYYGIKKTCELLAQKAYWPTFRHNIKVYVKGCDMYLILKAVRHKTYSELKSLPWPIHP